MCKKAIEIGYRHIDTAAGYGNEEFVGKAIRDSGVPRSEFFVTTKLPNGAHDSVREAFERSLATLNIEYIDLYLVHWPQAVRSGSALQPNEAPTVTDTWAAMEKLVDTGKVKSIGVSNFSVKTLESVLHDAKVVPAVNQVEIHAFLPQVELRKYCEAKGIHVTAYSPFGQPGSSTTIPSLLKNDTITRLAEQYNATTGQILLSWGVQNGVSVIPKSENDDRLRKNFTLIKLEEKDIKIVDELHKQSSQHRSLLSYHNGGKVFGWTYDQLGWNFINNGIVPPTAS